MEKLVKYLLEKSFTIEALPYAFKVCCFIFFIEKLDNLAKQNEIIVKRQARILEALFDVRNEVGGPRATELTVKTEFQQIETIEEMKEFRELSRRS